MEKHIKESKPKSNSRKKERPQVHMSEMCPNTQRELYLEHLMDMTVGLLGNGFQKG